MDTELLHALAALLVVVVPLALVGILVCRTAAAARPKSAPVMPHGKRKPQTDPETPGPGV
ncbi:MULTISPECIES: hypothetical protein [Microvirgula]|uniref:hypothetical protein n=1 Tax=Microvirgula TaxID=57479 RepID=UPI00048E4AE2|nr:MULTISPECIES: hypothetical protein [Microvirgula]RAS09739.1 hypothetical protein DFO50_13211 [Microvirgula sp. AG722]